MHFIKASEQMSLTVADQENLGQPKKTPLAKNEFCFNRVRNGQKLERDSSLLAEAVLAQIDVPTLQKKKVIFKEPLSYFKLNEGKRYPNYFAQDYL